MISDIFRLCREKNITLAQLARQCRVSGGYITLILQGKRKNVSLSVLERIAQALDISLVELIGDTSCVSEQSLYTNAISDILATWDVSPACRDEFSSYLSDLDKGKMDPVLKLFTSYENSLIEQFKCGAYSPNQVKVMVLTAFSGGRLEDILVWRLLNGESVPPQAMIKSSRTNIFTLKIPPKCILDRYACQIPETIEDFRLALQMDRSESKAYLHIGRLCTTNNFEDLAITYYGNAALSALAEEKIEVIEECIHKVNPMKSSKLKQMILAWYESLILGSKGLYKEIYNSLQSVIQLSTDNEIERRFMSRIYSTVGATCMVQGRYEEAYAHYCTSIRLWPSGPLVASTYMNIGTLMRRMNDLLQAEEYFKFALNTKEPSCVSRILTALAQIALDKKEFAKARKLLVDSNKAYKEAKAEIGKSEFYLVTGIYYKEIKQYKRALYIFKLCFNRATDRNETRAICYALIETADVYIRTNQFNDAERIMDNLPELMAKQSDIVLLGLWLNNKAKIRLMGHRLGVPL